MRTLSLFLLIIICTPVHAQQQTNFTSIFQLSLVPGIGTNGMHPGGYINYFSLNFTSGYSKSNYLLELGTISNLNTDETRGLQLAGIANLTGANAFAGLLPKARDEKIRSGFEANLSGLQLSGVTNVVLNNVFGGQVSGGANVAKGALQGFQLAGVMNVVYKYSFGVQVSGAWNVSFQSMDGVQLASLGNFTDGGLYGTQIGVFNFAGLIEGKNSYENNDPTGLQIGVYNSCKRMNGFQIGLVNRSRSMQGTQIGLINIYKNGSATDTRDGTSIGLINIGSSGYGAVYVNELFATNLEIATGTFKNQRIKEDRNIYIQNALLYSNEPSFLDGGEGRWAIGYGLKKFFFNRTTVPGMNNFRFISYGVDFLHVNHERSRLTKELSLIARPRVSVGTRLHPKLQSIYLFAGLSYNFYFAESDHSVSPDFLETSSTVRDYHLQMWPGFMAGVYIQ